MEIFFYFDCGHCVLTRDGAPIQALLSAPGLSLEAIGANIRPSYPLAVVHCQPAAFCRLCTPAASILENLKASCRSVLASEGLAPLDDEELLRIIREQLKERGMEEQRINALLSNN